MSESGGPRYDTNQDIMNASASLSNGLLTVNFTRPIIIMIIWQNATAEDVSLDDCRCIWRNCRIFCLASKYKWANEHWTF